MNLYCMCGYMRFQGMVIIVNTQAFIRVEQDNMGRDVSERSCIREVLQMAVEQKYG